MQRICVSVQLCAVNGLENTFVFSVQNIICVTSKNTLVLAMGRCQRYIGTNFLWLTYDRKNAFVCITPFSSDYLWQEGGRGNSTVVSVSVYQAGDPGSRPPRSACHRKVEFYHCVIGLLPPVPKTGSKKAVHVLLCLCNNACKRSLAICRKSRALCLASRLLSVPIWPACIKQGR